MSSTALAQSTATSSLQAKIIITSNCAIVGTKTDLDFASHASTETTAAGASNGGFTVSCTNLTPYKIGLQSTSTGATTDGAGKMTSTAPGVTQSISYKLFQDPAFGTTWGNDTGTPGNIKTATGNGANQVYVVYGQTTSSLNVPAATYTDTVNINVYY